MKLIFKFGDLFFNIVHSRTWWKDISLDGITMRYSDGTETTLARVIKKIKKL